MIKNCHQKKSLKNASSTNSSLQCISNSKTINFSSNETKKEMNAALKCATWKKCNFSSPFFWCVAFEGLAIAKEWKNSLYIKHSSPFPAMWRERADLHINQYYVRCVFRVHTVYALQFPRKKQAKWVLLCREERNVMKNCNDEEICTSEVDWVEWEGLMARYWSLNLTYIADSLFCNKFKAKIFYEINHQKILNSSPPCNPNRISTRSLYE